MNIETIIRIIIGVFGAIPAYVKAWMEYRKWVKKNPNHPSMRRWLREIRQSYIFWLGILLTIAIIVVPFIVTDREPPAITITVPSDNARVPQEITVEGYANKELPENQYLYIVIEYGGRWWPQYGEVIPGYSHGTERYKFSTPARIGEEEDIGRTFTIRAILVEPTIHQHFQNWFQECTSTGEWHGIPITEVNRLGEVETCDYITVIRR